MNHDPTSFFWSVAAPFLEKPLVTRAMMRFPCLRVDTEFFAFFEPKTGDLLIKLPSAEVVELIESRVEEPLSPAGRTFQEWVVITKRESVQRVDLIEKGDTFVSGA